MLRYAATGSIHSCAITTANALLCWGAEGEVDGQAKVPFGVGAVQNASPGLATTCAVRTAGSAACWGYAGELQTQTQFRCRCSAGAATDTNTNRPCSCLSHFNPGAT